MTDKQKTKAQLVDELEKMRRQVSALEKQVTKYKQVEEEQQALLTAEREQRLLAEILHQMGAMLSSSLNYETVLDFLLDQVGVLIPHDAACIMLIEDDIVRVARWHGYTQFTGEHSPALLELNLSDIPALRQMKETRQPLVISSVAANDPQLYEPGRAWIKSHLSVPINIRDRAIGFLKVDSITPNFFTQTHAQQLQGIVEQAAIALRNAQLYDQARQEITRRIVGLKQERNFVSAVLNTAGALVMVLNPEGRILRFNRACQHTTGYTFEEVKGRHFWGLFLTSYEVPKVKAVFEALVTDQAPSETESLWITKEGKQQIISWSNNVLLDSSGQVEYIISTGIDITERRQLEDRLVAIHQLGRELNLLRNEADICNIALETASFLLPLNSSGYGVVDETAGELEYYYYPLRGVPQVIELRLPLDNERRVNTLSSYRQTTAAAPGPVAEKSDHVWLTAPMIVGERTIGMLDVKSQEQNDFSPNDQQLLQTLADQTAVAIENARLHRETQQRIDELKTLSMISQAVTSTLNLEETLTIITDNALRLLDATAASVVLQDQIKSDLWFHAASGGVPEFVRGIRLAAGQGIVGWVIKHGQPALVPDVSQDPRFFSKVDRETGFVTRSVICVPLKTEEQTTGAIEVMNKKNGSFSQEDLRLLSWLATPATIAIENARLFQAETTAREQAELLRQELQSLSRRLVQVQETERRHIARELHDEAGQALTSLMVGLGLLERGADNPKTVVDHVNELKSMTNDVLENLHRLAMDLRPASLDHLGLTVALRQYIKAFSRQYDLKTQFEVVGLDDKRLPSAVETNLYRIVQEALTNVVRHAQATRVDVLLERRGNQIVTIIEDDGIGFDAEAAEQSGRLGLLGMRERAEMLEGTLAVESTKGATTTIYVEVPYDHSNPDR
jgi:PAS domain S-box-containing protein